MQRQSQSLKDQLKVNVFLFTFFPFTRHMGGYDISYNKDPKRGTTLIDSL